MQDHIRAREVEVEIDIEKMMRDALDAEPPADADASICAAISLAAAARRRKRRWRVLAAAAALAVMLGGGIWQYGRHRDASMRHEMSLTDESDIMLEIIDMAEPPDIDAFQVAQL